MSSQVPTTEQQQQLAIKRERIRMNGILKEKEEWNIKRKRSKQKAGASHTEREPRVYSWLIR